MALARCARRLQKNSAAAMSTTGKHAATTPPMIAPTGVVKDVGDEYSLGGLMEGCGPGGLGDDCALGRLRGSAEMQQ